MSIDMFTKIYPGLIRSHMEFAVQAWSPHLQKDILLLENVQRRATKIIPAISDWTYEARLKKLGLTTLAERRRRGDLIEVYKIMNNLSNVDRNFFFYSIEKYIHTIRGDILLKFI